MLGSNLPAGFGKLARALQVLLGLCGVAAVAGFGVEIWASTMLSAAAAIPGAAVRAVRTYRLVLPYFAASSSLVFLVAGVLWLVWQHQFASAVPRRSLRRSPGWHVGSWLVPVVNLWFPFQNIVDLRRTVTPRTEALDIPPSYRLWWGLWLATSLIQRLSGIPVGSETVTLSQAAQASTFGAIAEVFAMGAAACAIVVVRDLTAKAVKAAKAGEDAAEAAAQR
jgi:hypothetical protein